MLKTAKKYLLGFTKENENKIITELEKASCFEIEQIETQQHSQQSQQNDFLLAQADFAIGFLKPYNKEKKGFIKNLTTPYFSVKKDKLEQSFNNKDLLLVVEKTAQIEKQRDILQNKAKEITKKLTELACFGNLGFCPQDTRHFALFIASLSTPNSQAFFQALIKQGFYHSQLSLQQNKAFVLMVVAKENKEKATELLKQYKGEVVAYNFQNSPIKEKELLKNEAETIKTKLNSLEKELYGLALHLNELKIYRDSLALQKVASEIKVKQKQGAFLKYIAFWALEENVKLLKDKLKAIESNISIIDVKLKDKEEPPVVLANNKAVRPFEYVTEIFGAPKSNEIDPTPYLAFFFILFFGICITDAAYGLIMALFCGLALIFLKERFGNNKLIKLLFYAGISTFIVGVLFGSYFGASAEQIGLGFLGKLKLIDPFKDTIIFLGLAFALGFLQLLFAQVIKVIAGVKDKNKPLAYNGIAWGTAYVFGALFGLGYFKYPAVKPIGMYGLLISGVGLLLAESMGIKMLLKPLAGAVKVLQGLIGTMSDILSYSRLMALGLATAVIALIVNQIAFLFGDMIPVVGFLVTGLVLIGGHLFNLGINALGGFIHSGRLQFVEFFPKFLEGGGRRLKPLKGELKYVKIT